jgi:uncharacterized DUF497 family protein
VIAIEVDSAKDAINQRKHGVALAAAALLFDGPILRQPDDRFNYGEDRWLAVGRIGDQVFAACYTMRGRVYRIISLRPASRKEREAYAQAYP